MCLPTPIHGQLVAAAWNPVRKILWSHTVSRKEQRE